MSRGDPVFPGDHQLLEVAHAGSPLRGVRVTARRGVWAQHGPWRRFENEVTVTGWVALLDEQSIELIHGWLTVAVLLGDIEHVSDDVPLVELAGNPTVEEALALSHSSAAA